MPFVPAMRLPGAAYPTAEIVLAAPPVITDAGRTTLVVRLLPVLMAVATIGMMLAVFHSGSGAGRHPMLLTFPAMMLLSAVISAVSGRDGRAGNLNNARSEYLTYLARQRDKVIRAAAAQHSALLWAHPEPESLWTLIGGDRMWERRPRDPDFCQTRLGVGNICPTTRVVAPESSPADRTDPVTGLALQAFSRAHATISDAPVSIKLQPPAVVSIDGDPTAGRGLLRAVVCQLAVLHTPGDLLIAASTSNEYHWEWLKWLPHNQHPSAADGVGPSRLIYSTLLDAESALGELVDRTPQIVLIVDSAERAVEAATPGVTVLELGSRSRSRQLAATVRLKVTATELVIRHADAEAAVARPDRISTAAALACARRLAAYRAAGDHRGGGPRWQDLVGVPELTAFDPASLWRSSHYRHRLCVPVGTTPDGAPVELDIKEAAENGVGPHGLCIGATGSGKSEFLRTVALGMMARHSPELLNLVLVDFKGGATFRGLEHAPHVAAVITNLSDDAVLVERMRDALAGEMNRRQQILRAAGDFVSVAAYERARRAGAQLSALPVLFVIVDEFSELLAQQPDFADMFAAVGRLGRSLGVHLLLASQRLDEGRLRGLESHLSYRVCLKTLTVNESRVVLGTPDAYHLPNTPGAAYLRPGAGDLVRFQSAFVSGHCAPASSPPATDAVPTPLVRLFSAAPSGAVTGVGSVPSDRGGGSTVLQQVVERLCLYGPPAHQVWLPPLGSPPSLDTVLRDASSSAGRLCVPIGVVDRPFDQKRTALTVELCGAAGNIAVVGSPQSGKTTALRTIVTALAATHDPNQVQFYCLDFGGGALTSLRALPHTGSVAGRAEPELVARTIAQLESLVRRRERFFSDHGFESMTQYRQRKEQRADDDGFGDVFLVIDGWAAMRRQFETLEASITALAVQGLSFGVHVALSASRWADIRPAIKDAIGTRIELRLGDAAESEVDRKHAQRVPRDSPGRGLCEDGLHMAIALPPRLDGVESSAGLSEATLGLGQQLRHRYGGVVAPPITLLPAHVDHRHLIEQAGSEISNANILLGLESHDLRPVTIDFGRQSHLLVVGDAECGKTTTLRTVCREIVRTRTAAQARLFIADFRRGLLGVVGSGHLGGYAVSAPTFAAFLAAVIDVLQRRLPPAQASLEQLRDRSWWSGPEIYFVVDDYDLVATTSGSPLTPLVEYLPHAVDLGLHVIVARRSAGAARAMFEPMLCGLRDAGAMGLIMSGSPDEGALIGSVRPTPLPPGRGTLVTRSRADQLVQVACTPAP
ncbi:type VII secretion protein EccCa [Mycobacterium sp.]|uniref:type VII secretion protein EccCa n=1 Tax=Mycobacterium sp. TaxID=1785 RepID=UPI003CC53D43